MIDYSNHIDEIEGKLIKINKDRKARRKKNDENLKMLVGAGPSLFKQNLAGRLVIDQTTKITD